MLHDNSLTTFLQQVVNGVQLGSIYALIALGYTMVYGVLKLINFAHSDVFMLGAYISYYTVTDLFKSAPPSWGTVAVTLAAAIIGCGIIGVLIERLAYRPVRNAPRLTPLITAIGVSLLIESVTVLRNVFGPEPKFLGIAKPVWPGGVQDRILTFHHVAIPERSLILVAATLVLLLVLWFVVTQTKIGKAIRAVSQDKDAASLMGINTDRVISFTFFLGSGLAGAAGFLFAATTGSEITPYLGVGLGIKAFVAAVLGGIGNIPGAALGGLIMGLAETFVQGYAPNLHIPPSYSDAVGFVILIVILLVRPTGLLGKSGVEKV